MQNLLKDRDGEKGVSKDGEKGDRPKCLKLSSIDISYNVKYDKFQ